MSAYLHACCRGETIRSALEVLAVCTVIPKAQLQLCEQVRQPDADPLPAIRFMHAAFIVTLFCSAFAHLEFL